MKRLFALIGFTYLSALTAAVCFGEKVSFILFICFFILFIISLLFRDTRSHKVLPIALFVASTAFCVYSIIFNMSVNPIYELDEKEVRATGTICEIPYKEYGKYHYTLKIDRIDDDIDYPKNLKVRVTSNNAFDADVYDKVTATLYFCVPKDTGISYSSHYRARGINLLGYIADYDNISVEQTRELPLISYVLKIREKVISTLSLLYSEEQSAIASGMILGDKSNISPQVKSNFRDVGISHLLVVSGIHVSIVSQFIMILCALIGCPKKISAFISIASVLFFVALSGFSPSSIRAGVMLVVYLLGLILNRSSDSLNSLGLAILIILLFNPFAAGDIGLLLSFSATLGIVLLNDKIDDWIMKKLEMFDLSIKLKKSISSALSMTIAATIFTLPIIILSFGTLSLISPISNILVVFPSTLMVIFVSCSVILYSISWFKILSIPFIIISKFLISYIGFITQSLARIPFSSIYCKKPFMYIWICSVLILLAVSILLDKGYKLIRISSILSIIILFAGILSYEIIYTNKTSLALLNTGNGISAVLHKNGHAAVVSCGGSSYKYSKEILRYLNKNNIKKIDCMILPDSSKSSSYYVKDIISEYEPLTVLSANNEDLKYKLNYDSNFKGTTVYFAKEANSSLWSNVKINPVYSDNKGWISLNINDLNVVLCPSGGDSRNIPSSLIDCDILAVGKVPKNINRFNPVYTIFSMDNEKYINNIKRYSTSFDNIISTSENGVIIFDFIKDSIIRIRRES